MIPVARAISILDEIKTSGHSPLKVQCDDGNIYIVKKRKHHDCDTAITSEFICNYLCKIWNLETPEAALVSVSLELINDHPKSQYHRPNLYKDYLCFGSKFNEDAIDLEISDLSTTKQNLKVFENPLDFLKIGLFDLWVVNIDRKPKNLNLMKLISTQSKFHFLAIDHAYAFDDMVYDQINPKAELSINESILSLGFAKFTYNNFLNTLDIDNELYTYYINCINQSQRSLILYLDFLTLYYTKESEFFPDLLRFIFNDERNGTIFADFLSRLK